MAVSKADAGVKVRIACEDGSAQTISKCNKRATDEQLLALTKFADLLGLAFQITDDILDVEGTTEELGKQVGSDEKNHKSTYVSLYGLAAAHELAEKTINEALECLNMFGENAEPLRQIAKMMTKRKN